MSRVAIWAQLEAKPGKEKEVEEFLKSAQPLAEREPGTLSWYAIKMGPGKYGIFDRQGALRQGRRSARQSAGDLQA